MLQPAIAQTQTHVLLIGATRLDKRLAAAAHWSQDRLLLELNAILEGCVASN